MSRRRWSHRPIQRAVAAARGIYEGKDAARLVQDRAWQIAHSEELVELAKDKRLRKADRRRKRGVA